ncbi:phosphoglycerate kinase [Candidatus Peregrinibacteria bacterium]|nr:phosphoglycerate kinase [Candidatus Peregrinibacteria bacterium]
MPLRKLSDLEKSKLQGKKVLMRVDFNVPLKDGIIADDSRIRKTLPTITYLLENGAALVLMSHLGRPKGKIIEELRLDPIAKRLSELLKKPVQKMNDCIGEDVRNAKKNLQPGEIMLLENTRFYLPETENLRPFAAELASECDMFVQEAFGTIHRAHASTEGVAHYLPSMKGFLVEKEVDILTSTFKNPEHPLTLVIGGAKIDTKIGIIHNFLSIADNILIGGGLANTLLFAKDLEVGGSLCEKDKLKIAQRILMDAGEQRCKIYLPRDVVVAKSEEDASTLRNIPVDQIAVGEKIFDIGEKSRENYAAVIKNSKMVIWNGPMGLFENPLFANGTRKIAEAMRDSEAKTIIGGGDSVEALAQFGISEESYTHVSTGGGAMLEFLEGKVLPGLVVLKEQVEM